MQRERQRQTEDRGKEKTKEKEKRDRWKKQLKNRDERGKAEEMYGRKKWKARKSVITQFPPQNKEKPFSGTQ